jgi:protein phosphatase
MEISFHGATDIGKVRRGNEDYFASEKIGNDEYLFIVADGMGGHKAGDIASKLGTVTFIHYYKNLRAKEIPIQEALSISIQKANATILEKAAVDFRKKGMGTTFSALVIANYRGYMVHVGDSRIYLIRRKQISRLTKDHTFVERMVEEGRITEEEAHNHPQKNILYMSLGARASFEPEISEPFVVKEGDVFVICSDGLSGMVDDNQIKDYAVSYTPKEIADKLISIANDNGGIDNITIQVISVGQLSSPEKTEPIPIITEKKPIFKIVLLISLLILIIILLVVTKYD